MALRLGSVTAFQAANMNMTLPDQSTIASMSNVDWAWEFLRRNPDYKRDYRLSRARLLKITNHTLRTSFIRIRRQCPLGKKWGLIFMCDPELSHEQACVAWRKDCIGWSIKVTAEPKNSLGDKAEFDLKTARFDKAFVVIRTNRQCLYMRIGLYSSCLDISGISVLTQPVGMQFIVNSIDQIQNVIPVLQGVLSAASGAAKPKQIRIPEQTKIRRLHYLIAADNAIKDALLREIAVEIFGKNRTANEWKNPESRAFKDKIKRAKRRGLSLMQGEYRKLLH